MKTVSCSKMIINRQMNKLPVILSIVSKRKYYARGILEEEFSLRIHSLAYYAV